MSELRIILLLIGVTLVVVVYVWGRWKTRGRDDEERKAPLFKPHLYDPPDENEPDLIIPVDDDRAGEYDLGLEDEEDEPSGPSYDAGTGEQKIFSLRVVARGERLFSGRELLDALNQEDVEFGKYDIFHKLVRSRKDLALFSVANLNEPGTFELKTLEEQGVIGIVLFMVLPGPQDGVEMFSGMFAAAKRIAGSLDGEVHDESGCTLSAQRERNIHDEIIEFQHFATVERGVRKSR